MNKLPKRIWWYQFPAVAWAGFIFIASSLPRVPTPQFGFSLEDKLLHAIAFAVLAFFCSRALFEQRRFEFPRRNYFWIAILASILYGITDEYHQSFVPPRTPDVADVIADALGAFLGSLLFRYRKTFLRAGVSQKRLSA